MKVEPGDVVVHDYDHGRRLIVDYITGDGGPDDLVMFIDHTHTKLKNLQLSIPQLVKDKADLRERLLAKRGDDFADGLIAATAERDKLRALLAEARQDVADGYADSESDGSLLARIDEAIAIDETAP